MSTEEYAKENSELLKSYLSRTFFKSWSHHSQEILNSYLMNYHALELYLNATCELNCKYCYVAKYGKEYFTEGAQNKDRILDGVEKICAWLKENRYTPKLEIFGGNVFYTDIGYETLDIVLDYSKDYLICDSINIPNNMNFLYDSKLTERMVNLKSKFSDIGVPMSLSSSVDGKCMDDNRPMRGQGNIRDDNFYAKLFSFAKEYGCGFHPMVYSKNIEKWIDNFLWFQDKFEEYDIPWMNIYLLQVRNEEWSVPQCASLRDFMIFLVKWAWEKCGRDVNRFIHFIFRQSGFNILSSWASTVGRGIGCSIQGTLFVRPGDLTFAPCHRTSYRFADSGRFIVENDKIVDIEAINPELLIAINSSSIRNFPMCEMCSIKHLCGGGCLGSQYESTGDMFTPIPSVCRMEHARISGVLSGLKEIGMFNIFFSILNENKKFDIERIGVV